jgi:hypothetical protein
MGILAPSMPGKVVNPTVPSIFPMRRGMGGAQSLLSLPQADATGKVIIGPWKDTRDAVIRLPTGPDGLEYPIPGQLSTLVPGGVPAGENFRVVQNYVDTASNDFSSTGIWKQPIASVTRTPGQAAPDGSNTAWRLTAGGTNGVMRQEGLLGAGLTSLSSFWIRRVLGSGDIELYRGEGSARDVMPVISEWERFTPTPGTATGSDSFGVNITTSGDSIDVWHPMFEDSTGKVKQSPSEYQEVDTANGFYGFADYTTENPWEVTGNIATDSGARVALSPVPTFVGWPASTNICINSTDITLLTKGASTITTLMPNEVAPDGSKGGVYRLEMPATGGTYLVLDILSTTDNALSVWAKKYDATDTDFTFFENNNGISSQITTTDDWVPYEYIAPSPTITTNITNGVDTFATDILIWMPQVEERLSVTPTMPTAGAPVSRDATGMRSTLTDTFNPASFALDVKISTKFAQTALSATKEGIAATQENADSLCYMTSSGLFASDGTNTATVNPNFSADVELRIGIWGNAAMNEMQIGYAVAGSWTWGSVVPYTGNPTTGDWWNLLYGLASGGCGIPHFVVYDKSMTTAQFEALT